jgi:hypothetical protein
LKPEDLAGPFPVLESFEQAEPYIRMGLGFMIDYTTMPKAKRETVRKRVRDLYIEVCATPRRSALFSRQ